MALQFNRGTNLFRQNILLAAGEPFYVTDAISQGVSPFWIGNGSTLGGIAADAANLNELLDVNSINPQNNQFLQYNTSTGSWENRSNITVPGTLTSTGNLNVDSGVLFVNAGNNRVGINNSLPNFELDVSGNSYFNGNITLTGDIALNGGDITSTSPQGNLFNAVVTDINIGNGATVAVRLGASSAGETHVKSPILKVDGNIVQGPVSNNTNQILSGMILSTTTTSQTPTNLLGTTFDISKYRSMEFTLQASRATEHQVVKCIVTHNGSSAFINTLSSLTTGGNLLSVAPIISGGNLSLRVTSTSLNTTIYKGYYTLLAI